MKEDRLIIDLRRYTVKNNINALTAQGIKQFPVFLILFLLFTGINSSVFADTVEFNDGKKIKNVTVKMEKDAVIVVFPGGNKEKYKHSQIKSTVFSPVQKPEPEKKAPTPAAENKVSQANHEIKNDGVHEDKKPNTNESPAAAQPEKKPSILDKFKKDTTDTIERLKKHSGKAQETAGEESRKTENNISKFYSDSLIFFGNEIEKAGDRVKDKGNQIKKKSDTENLNPSSDTGQTEKKL